MCGIKVLYLQAFRRTKPNLRSNGRFRHRAAAGLIARTPAQFKAASALSAPREQLLGPPSAQSLPSESETRAVATSTN